MKIIFALLLGLFVLAVNPVYAKNCDKEIKNPRGLVKQLELLVQKIKDQKFEVPCRSVAAVLAIFMNDNKSGGRKLEEDKPLDCHRAKEDLQEALNTAEIRTRIDEIHNTVSDEDERRIYEAAVFDDEGHYDARDLKILQLKSKYDSSVVSCS